jgi:uncharacterized protein (TIGR02246 family)
MTTRTATKRSAGSPEEQITRSLSALEEGWNRHDLAAAFASFANDADFVNVVGQWWRGRHEIVDWLKTCHRDRFRDSRLEITGVSIRFLRFDVAVVHLTWRLEGDRGPDGKGLPLRRGIMTLTTSRQGEHWLFDAAQNTEQFVHAAS